MKPFENNFYVKWVVVGMVTTFLVTHPAFLSGINYIFRRLREQLSTRLVDFVWNQTLISLSFFWFILIVGVVYWFVKGRIFSAEDFEEEVAEETRFDDRFN